MTHPLVICGLGPGGADQLTAETRSAIDGAEIRYLRTRQHPTAGQITGARSFDEVYDRLESFAEVYAEIVERLVAAVGRGERVVYIVPGSPLVLEESVRRLRDDDRVEVEVVPALSFLDVVWARLGVDPVDESVRLVDGHRFSIDAAGERGPLLVAHVHAPWVLSDIKLAVEPGPDQRACVLQRLGTPEERIFDVAWADLDRLVEPDHLTSIFLPELANPVANELARTVSLVKRLRQDCPWDRKQDHQSLRSYLLEETYELLDAIDGLPSGAAGPEVDASLMDAYAGLEEELGDVWFQVLFHAELAAEAGQFTIADVAATLHEKLVRRHPHVFGDVETADTDVIVSNWERIKQEEKQRESAMDGVPTGLPSLALAAKVLQRGRRSGATVDLGPLTESVRELLGTGTDEEALGRTLLALVDVAGELDLDAEGALRLVIMSARDRFRTLERRGAVTADWVLG